eukprot:CAMPEP_0185589470 /NCGR_PEP_ID=MMETSP0434-20130131/57254_1 /TAXON_ID=626734 ORGANISM="Favella taraikaensis, Strain Fe Narragansett Bay" /NCGR_SAMPLE_ID=MMETSP0434 /ASSEMBLY_ACC=CAM_ASM_000379 /LENGTH=36 /DNA_ID= /DNA_START= /DNA_END= /DNA_ORIENTATION=
MGPAPMQDRSTSKDISTIKEVREDDEHKTTHDFSEV